MTRLKRIGGSRIARRKGLIPKQAVVFFDRRYWYVNMVLDLGPLAFWPLWEPSGLVVNDISGNNYHGSYAGGVVLGQAGLFGRSAPLFNGVDSEGSLYSDALRDGFNPTNNGTLSAWISMPSGVWNDGIDRQIVWLGNNLLTDGTHVYLLKTSAGALAVRHRASSVNRGLSTSQGISGTGWFNLMMTWESGGPCRLIINGYNWGGPGPIGAWTEQLANGSCQLGKGAYDFWNGKIQYVTIFNRVLPQAEVDIVAGLV